MDSYSCLGLGATRVLRRPASGRCRMAAQWAPARPIGLPTPPSLLPRRPGALELDRAVLFEAFPFFLGEVGSDFGSAISVSSCVRPAFCVTQKNDEGNSCDTKKEGTRASPYWTRPDAHHSFAERTDGAPR